MESRGDCTSLQNYKKIEGSVIKGVVSVCILIMNRL